MSANLYQPDEEIETPVAEEVTEIEAHEDTSSEEAAESETEAEESAGA